VLKENNWPIVRDLVDEIRTVSEKEIIDACRLVYSRMKLAVEPSAGTGVAVALSADFARFRSEAHRGRAVRNVGVVLCGGNVDASPLFDWFEEKFVR
jgi:threonine dehydratase